VARLWGGLSTSSAKDADVAIGVVCCLVSRPILTDKATLICSEGTSVEIHFQEFAC
jgi:sorbitol-specific phosphotransferase system component IIBC